ncbi:MAG: signal recognition particle-docking protein FtsY [Bryobacterales bacterium]|nr:signal recognition particle-docking protein FtsY [Bryobacterales bacterium]
MRSLLQAQPERPGLLGRLRQAVSKTSQSFRDQIGDILAGAKEFDEELLEDLEMTLIGADLGVKATSEILEDARTRLAREQLRDSSAVTDLIASHMLAILRTAEGEAAPRAERPDLEVILVVGVNGVGKTTTIGKLALRLRAEGRNALLCAADTFRAAAAEQLAIWGERTDCPVIRQQAGADPSAVLYDSLAAAKARGADTVIVDTAGRLHNKAGLMAELGKIRRTAARLVPGAPHQVLLVLDAVTGQNGLEQARQFAVAAGVTGIALTKLDGTAKGGIAVAIAKQLGLPIRWVGVGEQAADLIPFEPETFVRSLFDSGDGR